ncbi:hypothetical protein [Nonomuraea gerenzanensis]|uniref:Integral membrane protein n=1 Tax=Nonomuraea gerenzanensis TaxID=93944 RepID=A0A1M4EFC1_9ACTN|nr:hypothetical protein [Nonomuraea gerenzanensis]UBU09221.1 hypothetical protein LCN96_33190 [Nonomuraea gerenzanensis]SBO97615.1 hypothetical protein BN4615_P7131 [Nonomuraea gerenzanensis]
MLLKEPNEEELMATVADRPRSGTTPAGWTLRAVVSAHVAAIAGQPVFAGVYLTGDYDSLRWHAIGADVVSSLGYVQVVVAIVVWVRLRLAWPFVATAAVVAAETVQYFAGLDGALWLHLPLGVITVVALAGLFATVWRRPLAQGAVRGRTLVQEDVRGRQLAQKEARDA